MEVSINMMSVEQILEKVRSLSKEELLPYIYYFSNNRQSRHLRDYLGDINLDSLSDKIGKKVELTTLETFIFIVLVWQAGLYKISLIKSVSDDLISLIAKISVHTDEYNSNSRMTCALGSFYRAGRLKDFLDKSDHKTCILKYGEYMNQITFIGDPDCQVEHKILTTIITHIGVEESLRIAIEDGNRFLVNFIEELIAKEV